MQYLLQRRQQMLDYLSRRLVSPLQLIAQQKTQLTQMAYRLDTTFKRKLQIKQHHVARLAQNLQHLNPEAVLTRGYAFVQDQSGAIIVNSQQLRQGDEVKLTFGQGSADANIKKTYG
jgi:exodeoxyribonuclease VII large subunit